MNQVLYERATELLEADVGDELPGAGFKLRELSRQLADATG